MSIYLRPLVKKDWTSVSRIYAEGIATGLATFETEVPNWEQWNDKYLDTCRIVATIQGEIVGFATLSAISARTVYKGVAEVSVYVSKNFRGQNVGAMLLNNLINESENKGFWTLQAGIFSKNIASINLHKKCGFRIVGFREKIGQLDGEWHDNHLLEKRSQSIRNI